LPAQLPVHAAGLDALLVQRGLAHALGQRVVHDPGRTCGHRVLAMMACTAEGNRA
jgi:hypothetical protein